MNAWQHRTLAYGTTIALWAFVLLACLPYTASAETVLRIGESVSLADDQVVTGDFYAVAGPVSLSGTIEGDAHIIGGSVTTNGSIAGDLLIVGGTAQVHAPVADDVRIVGGEVTIAESVGGDVFVIGGVLTVLSSAEIEGSVFFYGGEAEINGTVRGHLYGAAEAVRVDGVVAGGVDISVARSLVLGDRADVGGDVRYESPTELTRAQNAVIVGDIIHNTKTVKPVDPKDAIVPFLIYAFSTLVLFALLRNRVRSVMHSAYTNGTRNGLIGIAAVIVLPVVVSLLFVSIIGIFVGFIGLFAMLLLYLTAVVTVPIFVGAVIEQIATKNMTVSLLWVLCGIVATQVLLLIPILGPIFIFAVALVLVGSMLSSIYHSLIT